MRKAEKLAAQMDDATIATARLFALIGQPTETCFPEVSTELRRLSAIEQQFEELQKEQLEQCRIIGMSAERELKLLAQIEELKKQVKTPIGVYMGHRLTPEGANEFWGIAETRLNPGAVLFAAVKDHHENNC